MPQNRFVQIPDVITVHLGGKASAAPDITVPFIEYLKGCAACLICPVWPEQAQRANIYAITSFALHRVRSGWYRARGYGFDVTASAGDDLPFNGASCLFCNTSCLVEELFNNYLARQGSGEPLLAKICPGGHPDGSGDTLYQDGAVAMAQKGYTAYDILRKYYGEDIVIIENAPRKGERERFLGTPLNCGAAGEDIRIIKRQLNRIGQNYPDIEPLDDGSSSFDPPCERAVRTFQYIFDLPVTGVLDKATWYSIKRTCAAFEQSEGSPFGQVAVPAMRPVSFDAPAANRPQVVATPENSPQAEEPMPGIVLPGRLISGSAPQRVVIPADDTLDSVISDEGVAERAEQEDGSTARQPESSAVENAARWSAARQSIMEGAPTPENGTLSSIITDSGIAARAEAANPIPGHPVPEDLMGESVLRMVGRQPESSAVENVARWSTARQSIMEGAPTPENGTLSSIITDSGIAARAEAASPIPGHPVPERVEPAESPISDSDVRAEEGAVPEGNALENAARWNATWQRLSEGEATDGAPLGSIIADSGIAARAKAAESPPEQSPISDSDVREEEGILPEGNAVENAARWNAARGDIPTGAGTEGAAPPQSAEDHLLKIGPSVSVPLPAAQDGVDSGYAVQWLRNVYDL